MSSLADGEKQLLLQVARRALELEVSGGRPVETLPEQGNLALPAGVFVTLRHQKRLRGCIGHLRSGESLAATVAYCARAAATQDPRFNPVSSAEVPEIEIELSVLSPLEDITQPHQIEIGRHGLFVSTEDKRGVLLPQVAVQFRWSAERFLEETCVKADLERDAWKKEEIRIQAFTAEIFSESEFPRTKSATGAPAET